jgi:hypothetical protein
MSTILEEAPKFGIKWANDAKPIIDRSKLVEDVCEEIDLEAESIKAGYLKNTNPVSRDFEVEVLV